MKLTQSAHFKAKAILYLMIFLSGLVLSNLFAESSQTSKADRREIETTKYMLMMHERHMKGLSPLDLAAHTRSADIGNIAVMTGDRKTLFTPNLFDLSGRKISFIPNASGGYDLKVSTGSVSETQGNPLELPHSWKRVNFDSGFSFPFYGTTYTSVFVSRRYGLTFKTPGYAWDLVSIVAGPPSIAAFLSEGIDSVNVELLQTTDKMTVTYDTIDFDSGYITTTLQVNLLKDGRIEFLSERGHLYNPSVEYGVVGITPGNSNISHLSVLDYSAITARKGGPKTSFLERFTNSDSIDLTALLQEFHLTHPQIFDFVTIFTDREHVQCCDPPPGYSAVKNSIKGIGMDPFDYSTSFGSPKLQGIVNMDFIGNYPSDPNSNFQNNFLGNIYYSDGKNKSENKNAYNTLELMANVHGQRWIPYTEVRINGVVTNQLLGKLCDLQYPDDCFDTGLWNFYMDTNASVMGGNDIRDNGDGSFTTVRTAEQYNKLDQYLMGFIPSSAVPSFFFVLPKSPDDQKKTGLPPKTAQTFSGRKVNVAVDQIIQAEGPRIPSSADSQKEFREAFIFLISPGSRPNKTQLDQIEKIRKMWESYFAAKTSYHGKIDTTLR